MIACGSKSKNSETVILNVLVDFPGLALSRDYFSKSAKFHQVISNKIHHGCFPVNPTKVSEQLSLIPLEGGKSLQYSISKIVSYLHFVHNFCGQNQNSRSFIKLLFVEWH